VLADNATLTKILTYHVVPGKLTPEQLAGTHKTLQGGHADPPPPRSPSVWPWP
jgi:uncharacterized surface protein with fasciclin (FAS1) repeats